MLGLVFQGIMANSMVHNAGLLQQKAVNSMTYVAWLLSRLCLQEGLPISPGRIDKSNFFRVVLFGHPHQHQSEENTLYRFQFAEV